MDQHDLDAIIKHLQADPVVKVSYPSLQIIMSARAAAPCVSSLVRGVIVAHRASAERRS